MFHHRFSMAIGAVLLLSAHASAQSTALTFRPVGAEYTTALDRIIMVSANPNQLHIYNAANNTETTVNLPKAPTAVSVSPDGQHAAVAHDALISYVNLATASVERVYPVALNATNIVLGAAYAYVLPNTSVNLSSGTVSNGSAFFAGIGRLHPSGQAIYSTRDGTSPNDIEKYDISTGPITLQTDSPYHGDYPACGQVWFSPDGSRIYNGCATVYRSSADPKLEMTYVTALPGIGSVVTLAESAQLKRIALIQGALTYYSPSIPPNDTEVSLLDSDYVSPAGKYTLTDFVAGANSFKAHGKWVFFNAASTALYVVKYADATSGLLNDFAVETIPVASPAPCAATFASGGTNIVSTGAYATVSITAAQGCIYQATSGATWIQLISGAYGSGNGTLTFLVRPNLANVQRSSTISVGAQTYAITQDAAPAVPLALTRLAYKIVDAEYSKSLDKVVFVTALPNELHIYDPTTKADQIVALPTAPLSVSVAPDGLHAAVGEDGWISYIDLQTAAVVKTLSVITDVHDIVLAGNGYVYAFPQRAWSDIYSIEVATGVSTATNAIYEGRTARLHPSGKYLYVADQSWSSKWDITSGVAKLRQDSFGGNSYYTCNNHWLTESGDRVFTACAKVYRASEVIQEDLQYNGSLSDASALTWAAHSSAHQSTAVVPAAAYQAGGSDGEIQMYGDAYLGFAGRFTLPSFTIGGNVYAGHGRYLFWNSNASKLIAIEQVDATSNTASDYGITIVSPMAAGCTYSIAQASVNLAYTAGIGTISTTAGANCAWTATSDAPWASITSGGFAFGSAAVGYSVIANPTTSARTAVFTIAGQSYTLSQAGAPAMITPPSASFASAGGTGTVAVAATLTTYSWTAVANAPWITITGGGTGTGNGTVSYSVAASTSGTIRTGSISIAGQLFSVTQTGVAPTFTFSPSSPWTLPSLANGWSVSVFVSPADAQWSATSNASWITITPAFPTIGNATVQFGVTDNTAAAPRTGTISVGGSVYTITQLGSSTLSLSSTSTTIGAGSAVGSVNVNTFVGITWTATTNAAWLTITSGASGTGSGTVTWSAVANPNTTARVGTLTIGGQAYTVNQAGTASPPASTIGLGFIPITPCRVVDTRGESGQTGAFGLPVMAAGSTRSFPLPSGPCGIPSTAAAYSVNVTVVPQEPLGFLSIWQTGQPRPYVSTLNSYDGRVVANSAIVPAGTGGAVSVYVSNTTHVVIDVNGYFDATDPNGLGFGGPSCRLLDTRLAAGPFGGPSLAPMTARTFALQTATCQNTSDPRSPFPPEAQAYFLNTTVVPAEALGYLTLWPSDRAQPYVSTLNSYDGGIVANAAIVARGSTTLSAMATGRSDLIIDALGYFAPLSLQTGVLRFYPTTPCRLLDTRLPTQGPFLTAGISRTAPLYTPGCGLPPPKAAFASINVTVVPRTASLGYLTAWTSGVPQPFISTLNSPKGRVVSNAAIIWFGDVSTMSIFATDDTDVIVDVNGYFAP